MLNSRYLPSTLHVNADELRIERSTFREIRLRRNEVLRVECRGVRCRQRLWFARLVFVDRDERAMAVRFQPNDIEEAVALLESAGWTVTYP
jgi:hypothetical protein